MIQAPLARVWSTLPSAYNQLEIPIAGVDPHRFELGNAGFRARQVSGNRLSRYLDCGHGITALPYADEYAVTLLVMTRLSGVGSDSTAIATIVDGSASPRDVSGNAVHCATTGVLESQIVKLINQLVRAGGN